METGGSGAHRSRSRMSFNWPTACVGMGTAVENAVSSQLSANDAIARDGSNMGSAVRRQSTPRAGREPESFAIRSGG
jgi:hypothetical protein